MGFFLCPKFQVLRHVTRVWLNKGTWIGNTDKFMRVFFMFKIRVRAHREVLWKIENVLILTVCNGRTRSHNNLMIYAVGFTVCWCCLVPIYAQEPVNCHSGKRLTPLTHKCNTNWGFFSTSIFLRIENLFLFPFFNTWKISFS